METSYFLLPKNLEALKKYSTVLCQNKMDADDLFQDTILKILEGKDKFDGTNPLPWMKTIMKYTFYNTIKYEGLRKTEDLDEDFEIESENYNDSEVRELINTHIPEKLRETFWLFYEGYTYEEIGKKLGIPVGTVKSRIFTARNILKPLKHLYM